MQPIASKSCKSRKLQVAWLSNLSASSSAINFAVKPGRWTRLAADSTFRCEVSSEAHLDDDAFPVEVFVQMNWHTAQQAMRDGHLRIKGRLPLVNLCFQSLFWGWD